MFYLFYETALFHQQLKKSFFVNSDCYIHIFIYVKKSFLQNAVKKKTRKEFTKSFFQVKLQFEL